MYSSYLFQDHAVQTVVDESIEKFFKEWEQKTEGGHDEVQSESVLEFLIGKSRVSQDGYHSIAGRY